MVRLGGAASATYISVFRGLKAHFRRHGIELDWVLYSDYDALVEAFVKREIDLAWNAPLPIAAVSIGILRAHLGCQLVEWLKPERGVVCCWSDAVSGLLQSGDDMGARASGSPRACSLI